MSRVYEALCQAGLQRMFKREPPAPEVSMEEVATFPPNELPDVWEQSVEETDAIASHRLPDVPKPAVSPRPLAWDDIALFHPDMVPESRLVALSDTSELGAEKFRVLRGRLRYLKAQKNIKSVVITSAVPEDGKSVVALNLAISLSKHTRERVLIIEGDLHKPVFGRRTGLAGSRGLSEWLSGETPIEKHIYHLPDSMLWVVPAGSPRQHPLGMLQAAKFLELMVAFRKTFDWILVDAPPLLPLADVSFWSHQTDGILLVVREGRTPAKLLKKGLETLDSARILGIVMNDTQLLDRTYYERYYRPDQPPPTSDKAHVDD
jgi:capsular exopolysaccharide synthesis family protein